MANEFNYSFLKFNRTKKVFYNIFAKFYASTVIMYII